MMSTREKVVHAYEEDALSDLLMGKWPYYEPEEYMAPSNVPTNWRRIFEESNRLSSTTTDLPQKLTDALLAITHSPEGLYCATEAILAYLRHRAHLSPQFVIDHQRVADSIRTHLPSIEVSARTLHLDWMGPTTETLWERLQNRATTLLQDHGVIIL
jgi:hypothetical protein